MTSGHPYQYVVLRCVPRVDREEFVNVGVVLFCQATDFLDAVWNLSADRLKAIDPRVDVDAVCERVTGSGATLDRGPEDNPPVGRVAVFRDPFGHRWFLNQPL